MTLLHPMFRKILFWMTELTFRGNGNGTHLMCITRHIAAPLIGWPNAQGSVPQSQATWSLRAASLPSQWSMSVIFPNPSPVRDSQGTIRIAIHGAGSKGILCEWNG